MGTDHANDGWTIQEVARATGLTSRTLRHYDAIGLLASSGTTGGGMRTYDDAALLRLQQVLALRELGVPLSQIAEVLDDAADADGAAAGPAAVLRRLANDLETTIRRTERQVAAVRRTVARMERGEDLVTEDMFDGFDHTQHREEVTARWGEDAYRKGNRWWTGLSRAQQAEQRRRIAELQRDWAEAAEAGADPRSPQAVELARRHVEWLRSVPTTTDVVATCGSLRDYVVGLAEMYVTDERFARGYGGAEGATFVRDAVTAYADDHLA